VLVTDSLFAKARGGLGTLALKIGALEELELNPTAFLDSTLKL
jgi:hypothetical protein